MLNNISKALFEKHGPTISITWDNTGRYGIKKGSEDDSKYRHWSFSLINCFIRLLAEDKE